MDKSSTCNIPLTQWKVSMIYGIESSIAFAVHFMIKVDTINWMQLEWLSLWYKKYIMWLLFGFLY